jgi:ATP-dependent helicase/DNAse subunit B
MRQSAPLSTALCRTAAILSQRSRGGEGTYATHDGDLTAYQDTWARRFGADHTWSASRLETYRTCPFLFFAGSVLGLEPRTLPTEGLDARQLGNIYHRLFEQVYRHVADPTDLDELTSVLPDVARSLLDDAPLREQFRATAWWAQTRQEIVDNVRDSLVALHALRDGYVPCAYEQTFGIADRPGPALVVADPDRMDTFRLRGYIDRVDRSPEGRLRIIDYKTGGYSLYRRQDIESGKKLQLPLYALAAQEALGLGEVADGFYWHVQQSSWHLEHSKSRTWFRLASADVAELINRACAFAWQAVRGARCGRFSPEPPQDGCPSYCPAAASCWRYTPSSW